MSNATDNLHHARLAEAAAARTYHACKGTAWEQEAKEAWVRAHARATSLAELYGYICVP